MIRWGRYTMVYRYFTGEKTSERLNNLPKITLLDQDSTRLCKHVGPEPLLLSLCYRSSFQSPAGFRGFIPSPALSSQSPDPDNSTLNICAVCFLINRSSWIQWLQFLWAPVLLSSKPPTHCIGPAFLKCKSDHKTLSVKIVVCFSVTTRVNSKLPEWCKGPFWTDHGPIFPLMYNSGVSICLLMQEMWVWSLGQEDPLEKEMATHLNILAKKTPWTEEPGGLQSMGSQRVGHHWATEHIHIQPIFSRKSGLFVVSCM